MKEYVVVPLKSAMPKKLFKEAEEILKKYTAEGWTYHSPFFQGLLFMRE